MSTHSVCVPPFVWVWGPREWAGHTFSHIYFVCLISPLPTRAQLLEGYQSDLEQLRINFEQCVRLAAQPCHSPVSVCTNPRLLTLWVCFWAFCHFDAGGGCEYRWVRTWIPELTLPTIDCCKSSSHRPSLPTCASATTRHPP